MGVLFLNRTRYDDAYHLQKTLQLKRIAGEIPDLLILTEHNPVITLGSTADWDHLLRTDEDYELLGINIFTTDRGGGVTYHGPGQLITYPILKLEEGEQDLHLYLRKLEQVAQQLFEEYAIETITYPGITGVFVKNRKVAQIGIRVKQWVTMHGMSLNVYPNLNHFRTIIPCGLSNAFEVGSLAGELGQRPSMDKIAEQLIQKFETIFSREAYFLDQTWLQETTFYESHSIQVKTLSQNSSSTP